MKKFIPFLMILAVLFMVQCTPKNTNKVSTSFNVVSGTKFINVSGKDVNGNEINLADYIKKNDFTILEFWASWCGPCRGEIQNLKNAYSKYKDKGLEIVSFSVDDEHKSWTKALDEENLPWPTALLENGYRNEYVEQYGLSGIPASYLIGKDGTIIASNKDLRKLNLDKTLSAIFQGK